MLKNRAYFFRNGVELTDHPANGMSFSTLFASTGHIGKYTARFAMCVNKPGDRKMQEYFLSVEDFDGPVMVKAWYAPGCVEWFCLADHDDVVAAGGQVGDHGATIHRNRDGRGRDYQGWMPFSELAGLAS
jgi:hypothetical protein